jgi:hypothetical protein
MINFEMMGENVKLCVAEIFSSPSVLRTTMFFPIRVEYPSTKSVGSDVEVCPEQRSEQIKSNQIGPKLDLI